MSSWEICTNTTRRNHKNHKLNTNNQSSRMVLRKFIISWQKSCTIHSLWTPIWANGQKIVELHINMSKYKRRWWWKRSSIPTNPKWKEGKNNPRGEGRMYWVVTCPKLKISIRINSHNLQLPSRRKYNPLSNSPPSPKQQVTLMIKFQLNQTTSKACKIV